MHAPRASTKARTAGGRLRRMGPRGPPQGRSPLRGLRPPQTARPRPADPLASGTRTPLRGTRKSTKPLLWNPPDAPLPAAQDDAGFDEVCGGGAAQDGVSWLSWPRAQRGTEISTQRAAPVRALPGPQDGAEGPAGGVEPRSTQTAGRPAPRGSAARPTPGFRGPARSAARKCQHKGWRPSGRFRERPLDRRRRFGERRRRGKGRVSRASADPRTGAPWR